MQPIRGNYFDGKTGKAVAVDVVVVADGGGGQTLELRSVDSGERILQVPARECRLSPAVGTTARYIELGDGAIVESDDHALLARLEGQLSGAGGQRWVHHAEKGWIAAVGALVLLIVVGWATYAWGIPWAAKRIAFAVPDTATETLSDEGLAVLETVLRLKETALDPAVQQELRAEFADVARYSRQPERMRLHFRNAGDLANAFALPNGTIVVTDQLVRAAGSDRRQVVAVLAHEAGHVVERHALRRAIQNAGLLFVLGAMLGDAGGVSSIAGSLPAILAQSNYSREHEIEADDFAASYCLERGWDPRLLGHILTEIAGAESLPAEGLWSSHPTLAERLQRLEGRAVSNR